MWRIIRTEVWYDRSRIGLFLLFCVSSFFSIWLGVKWERNRVPMIMLMVLVLSLSAVYAGEKNRIMQKRDRLHASLPVSLWQIGISHLFFPVFILLGIYFLLFISAFALRPFVERSPTLPSPAHMLTLTGLVLIVNAVILLHRDLRMTFVGKPLRFFIFLFWFVVYIGALLPFYVITNFFGMFGEATPAQHFLTRLLELPAGFLAAGVLFSALSLWAFVRRKSYAGS